MAKKKLYLVLCPIQGLSDRIIEKDEKVEIDDEQAVPLMAVGAVRLLASEPEKPVEPPLGEPAGAQASDGPSIPAEPEANEGEQEHSDSEDHEQNHE